MLFVLSNNQYRCTQKTKVLGPILLQPPLMVEQTVVLHMPGEENASQHIMLLYPAILRKAISEGD